MPRRIRDLVGALSALAVLVTTLIVINDQLRQSVVRFAGNIGGIRSSPFGEAAGGIFNVVKDFSVDNPFLFAFLIVTAVLVVLMLRT
jgi:hypothetical protein